jgi:hypothetical protein
MRLGRSCLFQGINFRMAGREDKLGADSEIRPPLKVAAIEKRLAAALETIGFKPVKPRARDVVVMNLNDESEVTIYLGAWRRYGGVLIDPVMVLHNARLSARLLHSGWKKNELRVCHFYLCMICPWNSILVKDDAELESAIQTVVQSVIEVGLPIMREYDSYDKVRKLFEDEIAHKKKRFPVAVLFEEKKLRAMTEH